MNHFAEEKQLTQPKGEGGWGEFGGSPPARNHRRLPSRRTHDSYSSETFRELMKYSNKEQLKSIDHSPRQEMNCTVLISVI